jgi:hypothetical protein
MPAKRPKGKNISLGSARLTPIVFKDRLKLNCHLKENELKKKLVID